MQARLRLYSRKLTVKFLLFFIASMATYHLATGTVLNPVLASALVTFLVSFIPPGPNYRAADIQGAAMGGSFIGMCSQELVSGYGDFVLSSIIAAVLFLLLQKRFVGVGGKLGMIAYLAGLCLFWLGESL